MQELHLKVIRYYELSNDVNNFYALQKVLNREGFPMHFGKHKNEWLQNGWSSFGFEKQKNLGNKGPHMKKKHDETTKFKISWNACIQI